MNYNEIAHRCAATLAGGKIHTVRRSKISAGDTVFPCPPTPFGVTDLGSPFSLEERKVARPTAEYTREFLERFYRYDPETGILYHNRQEVEFTGKRAWAMFLVKLQGRPAGYEWIGGNVKYRITNLFDTAVPVHRIAWALHYGFIGKNEIIDHINGDGLDNRISNLRAVSQTQNLKNSSLSSRNKSGIPGVFRTKRQSYYVTIGTNRLGTFKDFFEACCVRKSAEIKHSYHHNHGRRRAEVSA